MQTNSSACAVILFDGVCNLCNGAVNFVIDHDDAAYFKLAALQSEEAKPLLQRHGLVAEALDSIVLIENGRFYRRSGAVLRIAARLGAPWSWARALLAVPRPLRDAVYDWVASRRDDWFGKRDQCRVPTPELQARFLGDSGRQTADSR